MCTYNLFKFKYSCMVFSVPWNEMKMWHKIWNHIPIMDQTNHHRSASPLQEDCLQEAMVPNRDQPPTTVTPDHDDPSENQSTNDLLDTEIAGDVTLWHGGGRQSAGRVTHYHSIYLLLDTYGFGVRAQNLLWASFLRFGSPDITTVG
jgi:hypothetical protein